MSLLVVRTGPAGQLDVQLADEERREGGMRVFCRANHVVMTVAVGDNVVVRDVHAHVQMS